MSLVIASPVASATELGPLFQRFLASKKADMEHGELSPRTYADYCRAITFATNTLGAGTPIESLGPSDFERLYHRIASQYGIACLTRDVVMIRTAIKYLVEYCDVPPIRFGSKFKPPSLASRRKARNAKTQEHGERLFTSDQLRTIVGETYGQIRCMILLAINGGLNNSDLANLPASAIQGEWLNYPRAKTGVNRRLWLWPETREALEKIAKLRPKARLASDHGCVFITPYGNRWVTTQLREDGKIIISDAISSAFRTILLALAMRRPGLNFGALRHTYRTVADEVPDQPAILMTMGHCDSSISNTYRERISDERLQRISQHVRSWLAAREET